MDDKIKVFISDHCGPCKDIKELIEEGRFNIEDVDLIDVATEEGFPYVAQLNIDKIPSAYKDGKPCKITYDEENDALFIDCPKEDSPASGTGLQSPA